MTVESVTYIDDLDPTYPAESETGTLHEGNNHIRNIKTGLKNTFPNVAGAVTADHSELNKLDGLTVTTAQLNAVGEITASTAELNLLDGVTATTAELNILDGVTANAAEINLLTGRFSVGPYPATPIQTVSITEAKFTDIPSWTKRITLLLTGVSVNTTVNTIRVCIGTGTSTEKTGYSGGYGRSKEDGTADCFDISDGFVVSGNLTAVGDTVSGVVTLTKASSNSWGCSATCYTKNAGSTGSMATSTGGYKALSSMLECVSLYAGGSTFDAGYIHLMYE